MLYFIICNLKAIKLKLALQKLKKEKNEEKNYFIIAKSFTQGCCNY